MMGCYPGLSLSGNARRGQHYASGCITLPTDCTKFVAKSLIFFVGRKKGAREIPHKLAGSPWWLGQLAELRRLIEHKNRQYKGDQRAAGHGIAESPALCHCPHG